MNYKVGPEDVVVVDRDGGRVPPPRPRGLHARLRQRRVLLAGILAAIEFLGVAFWGADLLALVLFALLAVAAYWFAGRQLPPGSVREAAWIVAFAQGLLALVAVAIPVTVFFVFLIAVVVLLVLLMRLLGDRSRG
ncbi:MAG: hypothetical protein QOH00_1302 [Gaiellales bacterium]|nr:hypothetical protein [Gaiellales bacterium]